jgi:hypothetical protein
MGNEYMVRVSTLDRPFQDPLERFPVSDPGPTTLEMAWNYKVAWEMQNQGSKPIAEVVHIPTGRVVKDELGIKFFASLMTNMTNFMKERVMA